MIDAAMRRLPFNAPRAEVWHAHTRRSASPALILLSVSLGAPEPASASTPSSPSPALNGERPGECPVGEGSAIAELACELAAGIGAVPAGTLVVTAPIESRSSLKDPAALGLLIGQVVAGQFRGGARAATELADLTRARALASRAGTLVHVNVVLENGELRVVANLYPVPARFWDRTRDPQPSPVAHAFASRRLDPEIRSHLPPVPLVAARVDRAELPESHVLALGCADLDRDGALELVLLGRQRVEVGRIRSGKLARTASHSLADLSPVAPSPLREPIGAVALHPGSHADVGTSDRAVLTRFDTAFQVGEQPDRRLPWPGGGCSRFSGAFVSSQIEPCTAADPIPPLTALGWNVDAVAGAVLIDREGRLRTLYAGRRADTPEAVVIDSRGRSVRVPEVGAQLAVGDLDGDGEPEVLASLDTAEPSHDAVVVRSWHRDGRLEERLRIPVGEGVRAIAVCPAESEAMAPIAIATDRQLWVVR